MMLWSWHQVIAELDEKKREALEKTWKKVNQVHAASSGLMPAELPIPSSFPKLPMILQDLQIAGLQCRFCSCHWCAHQGYSTSDRYRVTCQSLSARTMPHEMAPG